MIAGPKLCFRENPASAKFGPSAFSFLQSGAQWAAYLSQTGFLVSGSDVLPANVDFYFVHPGQYDQRRQPITLDLI